MKLEDVVVEVRDRNLNRLGAISGRDLVLEATPLHNQVGAWRLSLPLDHPLSSALRTPGAGIVVSSPYGVIISGPVNAPETGVSASDLAGTTVFNGVSDNVWLTQRLTYPQPENIDTRTQSVDADVRTGPAETLIHGYVASNLGPLAPAGRRIDSLTMGPNLERGESVTKSAAFENLDELINPMATVAKLRYQIVDAGSRLVFETSAIRDLTKAIRLDVNNRTLAGYKMALAAPTATHAIVGAVDDVDRIFATVTTPESVLSSDQWGWRIEKFVNQAYTDDEAEWTASAIEMLASEGVTTTSVQAIPNDDETLRFGYDWNLGDEVTVVSEGREYVAVVTGLVLKIDKGGVQIGAVFGDVTVFNQTLSANKAINSLASRVSSIERNGTVSTAEVVTELTFDFPSANVAWSMNHGQHKNPLSWRFSDLAGDPIEGDLTFDTEDIATAHWYFALAGSCTLYFT